MKCKYCLDRDKNCWFCGDRYLERGITMEKELDRLAREVVRCASDNLILRNSSYEKDEELYSAIVSLAELLDEPIYNNWSLA